MNKLTIFDARIKFSSLTTEEVCKTLGVHRSSLCLWTTGRMPIATKHLQGLKRMGFTEREMLFPFTEFEQNDIK